MQVTIKQIFREPKTSKKTGKPFESVRIKTDKHGERFISGFGNAQNKNWQIGEVVDIEVIEKGEYLNFEMPRSGNSAKVEVMALSQKLDAIITNQRRIIDHLSGKNRLDLTSAGTKVPDFLVEPEDLNAEDVPF